MHPLLLTATVLIGFVLGIVFLVRKRFGRAAVVFIATVVVLAAIGIGPVPARPAAKRNGCIYFLSRLAEAKKQWALANNATNGVQPSLADLGTIDSRLRWMPECPDGGTYSINPVGQKPSCSRSDLGHVLP
jgi:hypothetical protein